MGVQKPLPFRGGVGGGACQRTPTLVFADSPHPNPSPEGEGLRESATRLAGLTGALLGWRPSEFWNATPAELGVILATLAPDTANPADRDLITQLKEQFPDG
jgi:Phage tail assembly chaperone protein, TAC